MDMEPIIEASMNIGDSIFSKYSICVPIITDVINRKGMAAQCIKQTSDIAMPQLSKNEKPFVILN